jgi:hypothetical protein
MPCALELSTGSFLLSGQTRIVAVDRESRRIAALFNNSLLAQHDLSFVSARRRH